MADNWHSCKCAEHWVDSWFVLAVSGAISGGRSTPNRLTFAFSAQEPLGMGRAAVLQVQEKEEKDGLLQEAKEKDQKEKA